MRCSICVGSGKVMGGGMMLRSCTECGGLGIIEEEKKKDIEESIKSTPHYKDAIDNIKALNPTITEEDAKKMFSEELKKIEDKDDEGDSNARKKNKRT